MKTLQRIDAARDQLNRTLTFFPRVDGKASVVLGVDTGLLAVLVTRALPYGQLGWVWVPLGLTLFLLAVSFWHLYQEASPSLEGGQESLLYFREIAKNTEAKYIDGWMEISEEEYVNDLLGQVWRNSEILKAKFDHLKYAFHFLALSLIPWAATLVMLSARPAVTS